MTTAHEFNALQDDVGEWSRNQFGDQPTVNPFVGTSEEVGELADRIDFTSPPGEEELDAVGDIIVYMADFCARRGLSLGDAYTACQTRAPTHDDFFREWVGARGDLSRSVLKQRQGIRENESRVGDTAEQHAIERLLTALQQLLVVDRGYTLWECVETAWDGEVSTREWDSTYTE